MEGILRTAHRQKRILLTGVFGPYGVDDRWGRKENIMELFHNQVTKGQGIASFRFHHRSFGLYFLAANVDAEVTVLDFPTRERYIEELKEGYDLVGISFITPNFLKAQEMARLARLHATGAEIALGGHGASIENVDALIDCDYVIKGDGIPWMRRYVGQDPDTPFTHPAMPSTERQTIFGVPVPGPTASILVPGVGCVNACSFCCTSHFFDRKYTAFIETGKQLFETARSIADARGTDAFFIMDENFLKDKARAMDLIGEMERHNRFFMFHIFSSAEAITAFGIDNLVRLGAQFVWVGFESQSRQSRFVKNNNIVPRELVAALRDHGISVLASGILCMEHHTMDNIWEDIDFLVDLNADMVQFMLLTPLPVTGLYQEHKARGVLRDDIPWEDIHGQKRLNYRHPAFTDEQPEQLLHASFKKDYEVNSSSLFRITDTALRGYKTLAALENPDPCFMARKEQLVARVLEYATMLPVIAKHSANDTERQRALALDVEIARAVRPPTFKEQLMRRATRVMTQVWKWRLALKGDMIQPATILTRFDHQKPLRTSPYMPLVELKAAIVDKAILPAAAATAVDPSESALPTLS